MIISGRDMRRFQLVRDEDVTGVSGTGTVAHGVRFPDGTVALRWCTEWPTSVVFHDRGMDGVEAVHGHGGKTRVDWLDVDLCATRLDSDLGKVQHAVGNVAQTLAENVRGQQLLDDYDAVLRFVPGLVEEVTRLRAAVRGGGWAPWTVGRFEDTPDDDLHGWRIRVGDAGECAWRLMHESRPGWSTLRGAPNGLPLLVREDAGPCDCEALGVAQ